MMENTAGQTASENDNNQDLGPNAPTAEPETEEAANPEAKDMSVVEYPRTVFVNEPAAPVANTTTPMVTAPAVDDDVSGATVHAPDPTNTPEMENGPATAKATAEKNTSTVVNMPAEDPAC